MRSEYFARVLPLLPTTLREKTVRVRGGTALLPLVELLAAAMVRRFDLRDATIAKHLRWKNAHESFVMRARGAVDLEIVRVPEPAVVRCRGTRIEVGLDSAKSELGRRWVLHHAARLAISVLISGPVDVDYALEAEMPFPEAQTVIVVGAGSVGSEVVRVMREWVRHFVIVDPATVSVFNPQRQWFGSRDVGEQKARVLAARVGGTAVVAEATPELLASAIAIHKPALVVLATGTHHHEALAATCFRAGVDHVAACAYPRAHFFEAIAVSPKRKTPCHRCFRGHLHRGVRVLPKIADEVAAFLYRENDTAKTNELVAEPALATDTARVADVAARLSAELLSKQPTLWFRRCLREETTCVLGANTAEGAEAYGMSHAGQLVRLGLDDLIGDHSRCEVCSRSLSPTPVALPELLEDGEADEREDAGGEVEGDVA